MSHNNISPRCNKSNSKVVVVSKVLVILLSNSLGDTIAMSPYVSEFQKLRNCEVHCSVNDIYTFLFDNTYQNVNFIGRDVRENYDEVLELDYVFTESIQSGYAKQLGFDNPHYIRPEILVGSFPRPIKNKYITLGVHSTSQIKYWNHIEGKKVQGITPNWNELCGLLRKKGYTPVTVEKYELFGSKPEFNGVPSKSNKQIGKSLIEAINLIQHSEFYIGLSSGMSWVAHALGKKVVMISNFTEEWNEFDLSLPDYIRITNKSVCHGCWNKINIDYQFDKNDWYWCPLHKDTPKQFECHTSITPTMVMNQIKKWL